MAKKREEKDKNPTTGVLEKKTNKRHSPHEYEWNAKSAKLRIVSYPDNINNKPNRTEGMAQQQLHFKVMYDGFTRNKTVTCSEVFP